MSVAMTDAFLYGWRVRSEFPLPDLIPWPGDDREPDIQIRLGSVPDRIEGAIHTSPFVQVDPRGQFLLRLDAVGAFHVASPREVVIAPAPGATDAEVRLFLLGSVLGFLCHLRGLLPLHASCVAIDGRAALLCGPSGSGKSIAALHMARRGHRFVADDVTAIDTRGAPSAIPAFPRLRLWQDALVAAGIDPAGLEANRPRQARYHYPLGGQFPTEPIPLGAIFLIKQPTAGERDRAVRLSGRLRIISQLRHETYRGGAADIAGMGGRMLGAHVAIAAGTPVYSLARGSDLQRIDDWIDVVEDAMRP